MMPEKADVQSGIGHVQQLEGALQRPYDRMATGVLFALIAVQVLAYASTYFSMADVWWRSDTFSHGFIIFPIVAWLVWRKREELAAIPFEPDLRAAVPLLLLVMAWVVAKSVDVLVAEQYAVVCMLPALVWLCAGLHVVKALAFPLVFLLFAVPVGEILVYPMMKFTAAFTVQAVRLTGIPVYWEGMSFTLPSGSWNVIYGCSGVRYIIASVTLGVLYAYLNYHSYWRRAVFILMSCIFPVFANGMRAFIIVMIGHISDMKLATGIDHLIYGWVWFGIVMFVMFWIGSYFIDDAPAVAGRPHAEPVPQARTRPWYVHALPGLILLVMGPAWISAIDARPTTRDFSFSALPLAADWVEDKAFTEWTPRYIDPDDEVLRHYSNGGATVSLYLTHYGHGEGGAELINSQNIMVVERHPVWTQLKQEVRRIEVAGLQIELTEATLKSSRQNVLAWHWNRVNGHDTSNEYIGKVYEAIGRLTGGSRDGFGIVVFTPLDDRPEPAREQLQAFLEGMMPSINDALRAE